MQNKMTALQALVRISNYCDSKYVIAVTLPLLYWAPKFTLCLILMICSFVLGVMFQEALVGPDGTFAIVKTHYENRIAKLESTKAQIPKSNRAMIPIELSAELDSSVNKLITFIVRDFVSKWWDPKFNHSGSTEFPDAIHEVLYSVFLTIGYSLSELNRADLILAVMQIVIEHVREYRKFNASGLDIEDFLKEHPESKFHKFHTRQNIVECLMDQSMRLCIHALPRCDRNSAAVFGLCREILATTVLLPVIEKVTNPVWLNEQLLDRLRKKSLNSKSNAEEDSEFEMETLQVPASEASNKPQPILWLDYLQLKRNAMNQSLKDAVGKVDNADNESMQLAAQRKLIIQTNIEELNEIISQQQEQNAMQTLVPLDNIHMVISHIPGVSESQGFSLIKSPEKFRISLRSSLGCWTIEKVASDFEELYLRLSNVLPRTAEHAPSNLKNPKRSWGFSGEEVNYDTFALQIEIWLSKILVDPIASLMRPVVEFLQPADAKKRLKRNSRGLWESANFNIEKSMQNALNSVGSTLQQLNQSVSSESLRKTDSLEQITEDDSFELLTDSVLTVQELEIILDVVFSAVEELFSLTDPDQWLRQQSLSLIKVLMKTLFGTRVSKSITSKLDKISSQETVSNTINNLTDRLWPNGDEWGKTPKVLPTAHEIDRVKHQLFVLLGESEEIPMNEEFKKAVKGIRNVVGDRNARQGLHRGFHLVQNQDLNMGLCVEILEVLVKVITIP